MVGSSAPLGCEGEGSVTEVAFPSLVSKEGLISFFSADQDSTGGLRRLEQSEVCTTRGDLPPAMTYAPG